MYSSFMNKLPLARNEDLVVQNLGKEILIYDLKTNKALNLNETSAAVYNGCDGKTSFGEVRDKYGFSDEIIFLALEDLKRENLIADGTSFVSPFSGMSRREVIKKIGLASMIALPIISAVVAPTSASAQSVAPCVSPGSPVGSGPFPLPGGVPTCNSIPPTPNVACCSGTQDIATVSAGICEPRCHVT
jgi:hypothetical protein